MAEEKFTTMDYELSDLRREREILTNELLEAKNSFASELQDVLGEQIKRELTKKEKPVEPTVKRERGFKRFLDNITKIFV